MLMPQTGKKSLGARLKSSLSRSFKSAGQAAAAAASMIFSGGRFAGRSGGGFSLWNWLPGSQYDYEREAGDLKLNSIVLPSLKWIETNFPEAPLIVRARNETGKFAPIPEHPLEELVSRPNAFYGSDYLWAGTNLSLLLDGNAYWRIVYAQTGRPVELWWIPSWMIEPIRPADGSTFLSHYDYKVNNTVIPLDPEDVIHFRDGVDDRNDLKGLSRLKAVLREVCTDNECATFAAAIMRNFGVPGVVISPEASATPGERPRAWNDEYREELVEIWKEKFTGDRRGEPFVFSRPVRVASAGLSPAELAIDVMRRVPEERITAAIGIPPIVVGMGAGLQRSTFNNFKEARAAAYESCIMPRQRIYAMALDVQLLPKFNVFVAGGTRKQRVGFDLSEVRALQDDRNQLFTRLELACGGPFLTPDEARAEAGFKSLENETSGAIREPKPQVLTPRVNDTVKVDNG